MKKQITYLFIFMLTTSLYGQWDVFPAHVSFRLSDATFDEFTHYTPSEIAFWTDTDYDVGTSLQTTSLRVFDEQTVGTLDESSLAFTDAFGDRLRLDYNGVHLINSASWSSYFLGLQGNGGELNLYTGTNGSHVARLGSTFLNSATGQLELSKDGIVRTNLSISSNSTGLLELKGGNGNNNIVATNNGPNHGWLHIDDDNGGVRVSIYSNSITDRGVVDCDDVIADVKNFKVPHPEDENLDIFYACVEGPEAGAYDRGTAQLVNGESFIPYSEHYTFIANPNTTTVQLTPHHWDTYGLAVVEKTAKGFRVRELKGGTGSFSFDWEIKSVRKGKEGFAVYRQKAGPQVSSAKKANVVRRPARKNPPVDPAFRNVEHEHGPNCIHSKGK